MQSPTTPTTPLSTITRRVFTVATALAFGLASGCTNAPDTASPSVSSHAGSPTASPSPGGHGKSAAAQDPVRTSSADWKPVTDIVGRSGKLTDNDTAYRIALPRIDLHVTTDGIAIAPGLSLGGYAAFARYPDQQTLLMGDLVVTETELPAVTDALAAHGIAQTALHKHLLEQTPPVWWTHIHGMGEATQLAQDLKAALDATAIPAPTPPPATQPPVDLDVAAIQDALGRTGTPDGGLLKFSIGRQRTITEDGRLLPPAGFNLATVINFQPLGAGRAAINGDFVLTADETQHVIAALRAGHISIVELHNHGLTEDPRLFYLHFWAVNDAVTLARALRPALDATNLTPGH